MKKDNSLYALKEWYDNKQTSAIDLTEKQFYKLNPLNNPADSSSS